MHSVQVAWQLMKKLFWVCSPGCLSLKMLSASLLLNSPSAVTLSVLIGTEPQHQLALAFSLCLLVLLKGLFVKGIPCKQCIVKSCCFYAIEWCLPLFLVHCIPSCWGFSRYPEVHALGIQSLHSCCYLKRGFWEALRMRSRGWGPVLVYFLFP